MTPAELRRHSQWLLTHAQRLREDAELALARARERRLEPAGAAGVKHVEGLCRIESTHG